MTGVPIEQRKAVARRLYEEVFGVGNLHAADEILAEGCVSHGPGQPPVTGREGIKAQAGLLRTAFPDLRVTCASQLAEGDSVATRWVGTGTFSGSFGGTRPTGAAIRFEEIRIDRFEGGRIVESWFIPDRFTLWQQLGLIAQPARPARG